MRFSTLFIIGCFFSTTHFLRAEDGSNKTHGGEVQSNHPMVVGESDGLWPNTLGLKTFSTEEDISADWFKAKKGANIKGMPTLVVLIAPPVIDNLQATREFSRGFHEQFLGRDIPQLVISCERSPFLFGTQRRVALKKTFEEYRDGGAERSLESIESQFEIIRAPFENEKGQMTEDCETLETFLKLLKKRKPNFVNATADNTQALMMVVSPQGKIVGIWKDVKAYSNEMMEMQSAVSTLID